MTLGPASEQLVDVLTLVLHGGRQIRKLLLLLKVVHGGGLLFSELVLTRNVCRDSRLPVLTVLLGHLLLLRHRLLRVRLPGTLILLAVEELVADAEVLLHREDDVGEPIIMAINLHDA